MTLQQKLAAIRMVMLDVDGVLTDGRVVYDNDGNELKSFHVHDGYGIARARDFGIIFALITGRKSRIVARRGKELRIREVFQGVSDKVAIVEQLRKKYRLKKEHICCISDDAHDIGFLKTGGLRAAPANAVDEVKAVVDFVTQKSGGAGAVRELLDKILKAKKLL
jgi:3-deoxy-D-manno-octulosonate 8-phosphate phosphatase (KDO 8-P phosphatase)